ncbi:MAG: glycosyltransferase family 39 protein [Chloroflexi bacterium]|nr:glycosyltransferase family 39 protein [Chloroflexota bacterium]
MQHNTLDAPRVVRALQRWWPLAVIVLLAASLRLYALDLIDVRFDEASAPQFALSIAQGQWLKVAPFSGSVANHPPVYLYTLALPYLFTRDFLAIAVYRSLLDVLAVGLCWVLCERYFNRRVATLAALLFAVAPWAVYFSRNLGIIQPPLFSVILLFGLLEALQRRNPWGWALAGLGLALCAGSHLSALYLVPVTIVAVLLGWRTLRPLPALVGLLPLLLLAFVYLQYDASHDFGNVRALLGTTGGEAVVNLDALRTALWQSGGMHLSDLTDGAYLQWLAQVPQAFDAIDTIQVFALIICIVLLAALCLRGLRRGNEPWPVYGLLLAWWCIPVLLQLRHSKPIQMHYLLPLYPVPFILMGLGIDRALACAAQRTMARWTRTAVAVATLTVIAGIVAWQCLTVTRFAGFVERYDTSNGGYGLPVRSALTVAEMAREARCTQAGCAALEDVIAVVPGGDPLVNEQATIMNVVLADMPHRFANSDAGLILRPDAAQYIFAPGTEQAMTTLLRISNRGNVFTQRVPIRVTGGGAYTYVRVAEPFTHDYTAIAAAEWANGVAVLGYRAEHRDHLHLEVLLRVDRVPDAGVDYHWFNHVLVNGQKVAQMDGGGIQPSNWRTGDVLLHWFDIPLPQPVPQPPYRVRIGAYLYPSLQNVPVTVTDAHGDPVIQDGVELTIEAE